MSGICGWVGGHAPSAAIADMAECLARFDGGAAKTLAPADAAVGAAGLGRSADVAARNGIVAAIWGLPAFSDAALVQLATQAGPAAALAEGYAQHGEAVLDRMHGAYALAVATPAKGEAMLAIDRAGIANLVWCETGGALVFASTVDALGRYPGAAPEVDPQAIYDYVYYHMIPGPETIHRGRRRLLPGELVRWRGGRAETGRYWEMRFVEDERRPFSELKERFVESLREAVSVAASGGRTGCFLSGGTDSSTIAGLLGQVTGQAARTYSIGFEAEGFDEMEYARIAARHFRTDHHEYYVTPGDIVEAIPRLGAVYDQPFGNSSAVPTYFCARMAKADGIEVLLGGDGGDELFGGNARYAKQRVYSLYSDLPAVVRKGLVEPLLFLAPEAGPVGKAQRYVRNASVPMPARYETYNLLEYLGPSNVFTPDFIAGVDQEAPRRLMGRIYEGAHAATLINRMLAIDLKFTLADSDIPKVARSCELAGVEVRFPMLNDAVVAFSATLHPSLKLRRTQLRWFFKEALRGFLPDEILAKKKHGFGLPFGTWLRTYGPLQEIARDSLEGLKARGIVRPEFIDELTGTRVQAHAGYYGTMVWVLMMLEQWFRNHGPK